MFKYSINSFPLEGIWLDIPYMEKFADFSVNETAFHDMVDFVNTAHYEEIFLMVGLEAGTTSMDEENEFYSKAIDEDFLIKSSINKNKEMGALT
jgi:alpha-glucosidase